MLRRQPPAYSPITLGGIGRAILGALGVGVDGGGAFRGWLERRFAADRAVLLGSGTQALRLALELATAGELSSSVALPAFSCFDVASAAVAARVRVRFYDLDPHTLAPDVESLDRALSGGARVAVVAPLYGVPVDWDAIAALLARHGAVGIEDAAQGHHATWCGRPLGSFGVLSVLSFGRGKGWTGGAGGALLLRSPWSESDGTLLPHGRASVTDEARALLRLIAQWAFGRPSSYALPAAIPWLGLGETRYRDAPTPRPMPRSAASCLAALRQLADAEALARRANAHAILDALAAGSAVEHVRIRPESVPGFLRLPLRFPRGLAGFESPAAAMRRGIAPSYPVLLAALPAVRRLAQGSEERWPGAEELVRTLHTVPTHSRLTAEDRRELVALLRTYRG